MNVQDLTLREKAHMNYTKEMLSALIPTLHRFNEVLVPASQRLDGRSAKQSLMALAMHCKQCETELTNLARQYEVKLMLEDSTTPEPVANLSEEDAVAYALRQEEKITELYNEILEDRQLDSTVLELLKHQLAHLHEQFGQLRFLHKFMPEIGVVA